MVVFLTQTKKLGVDLIHKQIFLFPHQKVFLSEILLLTDRCSNEKKKSIAYYYTANCTVYKEVKNLSVVY
jgi:hypothetical protein